VQPDAEVGHAAVLVLDDAERDPDPHIVLYQADLLPQFGQELSGQIDGAVGVDAAGIGAAGGR